MEKAVSMICETCHAPGVMLEESYERLTTGIRPTFWERQWRRVECLEFGVEFTAGLLLTHHQRKQIVGKGYRGGEGPLFHTPGRTILNGYLS